ncbi:MAG: haloacid dehalogenase-like hydrolase, partial [Victivallales bacterium]|nr:haloacid dehalogenase-like hydrolase [Victivallales bacterium]
MKIPEVYFFDMDNTLIDNDCDVSWKLFAVKHHLAPESDLVEAKRFFDDYNAGTLNAEEFYSFQFREFVGHTESEMLDLSWQHFDEFVKDHIYSEGVKLVKEVLNQGLPV